VLYIYIYIYIYIYDISNLRVNKLRYLHLFRKSVKRIKFSVKSDKDKGYFT